MSETDFLKSIFNDDTKETIMNMIQLGTISFIPITLLVKLMNIIPEASDKKGILENIFEIVLELSVLVVGIVIITKFSLYFKPFSGAAYPEFTLYPLLLTTIFLTLTFQSKISEKVFYVKEKLMNKVNPPKQAPQSNVMSQSMAQMPMQTQMPLQSQMPQMSQTPQTPQTQVLPNYNQMYENQPIETPMEPFASNAFGGIGATF